MNPKQILKDWSLLSTYLADTFDNEKPDLKTVLFLIGVQELGQGPKKFSKREKEELMHIAVCRLFSDMGYYILEGLDEEGWPHWNLRKKIPSYSFMEQEYLLKSLAVEYFKPYMEESIAIEKNNPLEGNNLLVHNKFRAENNLTDQNKPSGSKKLSANENHE